MILEKYGADALRFYLLTTPVVLGEDLNFSEKGVAETGRKINNLVYNVWSFLRMYHKDQIKDSGLNILESDHVLDRWIWAKLVELNAEVTSQLEVFNTMKAGKALSDFINEFSTWYLRRSRDRIKEGDKRAMEVLAYVLAELSRMLAPFCPFLADFIYKDLTGAESVHLSIWPNIANLETDKQVLAKMETVREVVTLGLSIRKQKNLSVRQPLAAFAFEPTSADQKLEQEYLDLIVDEMNIKAFDAGLLDKGADEGGIATAAGLKAVKKVLVDLNITAELKKEGLARDLERQVQDLRKKSGLQVGDLVDLYYNTASDELEDILLNLLDRKKTMVSQDRKSVV